MMQKANAGTSHRNCRIDLPYHVDGELNVCTTRFRDTGYLYEKLGLLEIGGCSDGEAKEKWNTSPYQHEACFWDQNRFNVSIEQDAIQSNIQIQM